MNEIINKLKRIEQDNDITILYAVESGSRAWGHSNENSDYDIRFIYKNNNIRHYLTINRQADVIESNDGLYDIVGWDIDKTLKLHYKSNPNLREWIISPIKYIPMKEDIFEGLPEFDVEVLKHHYFGLTKRHYRKYIKEKDDVTLKFYKKLLYTVRCILAWMLLDEGILPPMNLDELIQENNLDDSIRIKIIKLKDAYCNCNIGQITDNEVYFIIEWIVFWLEYMSENLEKPKNRKDIDVYNKRFQQIIGCDDF
ncbi:MAG: nucleotidyltransferase domain-containing protein [Methanosphaera sp.]|nr:nucleotidyltransferase domain-containing protein [Methanosphaera sp.]